MLEAESTPWPQSGQKEDSNDIIGDRACDFQVVAQCLSQLRHRVTPVISVRYIILYLPSICESQKERKIRALKVIQWDSLNGTEEAFIFFYLLRF